MIRRRSGGKQVTALLGVACALLAALIFRGLGAPVAPSNETTSVALDGVADLPPVADYRMAPLEDFAEIVERPLFSPTRTPAVSGAAVDALRQSLDLTLIGVVLSNEERLAIVTPGGQSNAVRLGVGDSIQGWTLTELESERATFERDGELQTLYLAFETAPTTPRRRQEPRDDAARQND